MKLLKIKKLTLLALIIFAGLGLTSAVKPNDQQMISISTSIVINLDKTTVLKYASDLSKDPIWRAEVDSMVIIKSDKYGDGSIEYSSFGKKGKTITHTYITHQDEHSIIYETPDTAKYYLASIREFEDLENGRSKITYTLKFDNNMTKQTSPFRIPKFLTKMVYKSTMKKYLKVLKLELEK